jgi:HEAT repeat protein
MDQSQSRAPQSDENLEKKVQWTRKFLKAFQERLNSSEAAVRGAALDELEDFCSDGGAFLIRRAARKGVLALMRDDDASVRAKAIAVAASALQPGEAVGALAEMAKDADAAVRQLALRSLLRVDPLPDPLLVSAMFDALELAAKDAEPAVRELAIAALPRLRGAHAGQVVSALRGVIGGQESEARLRMAAITALRETNPDAASVAVPGLIKALADPEAGVRGEAVSTLAWLGPEATSAIPAIVELVLGGQPESVRAAAAGALLAIDPEHQLTLPRLAKIKGEMAREVLLNVLRKAGSSARSMRKELQVVWVVDQMDEGDQATRRADSDASIRQPHADGPEAPNTFWWKRQPFHMTPKACDLLICLWEKEKIAISDIAFRIWGKKNPSDDQIRSALQEIRDVLLSADVRWRYGRKKGYILKQ